MSKIEFWYFLFTIKDWSDIEIMFRLSVSLVGLTFLDRAVQGILSGNFVIEVRKSVAVEVIADLVVDGLHLAVLDSEFLLGVGLLLSLAGVLKLVFQWRLERLGIFLVRHLFNITIIQE